MMSIGTRLKPVVDNLNRFSGWLLLLAVGWLCWVAARFLWLMLAPPISPALPLQSVQGSAASTVDNSGLFAIFADPEPTAAITQPPPNVILKGVLLAVPTSLSSALLDVNGEVKNYRIGDLLQSSGYTLVSVDWNEVILTNTASKQVVISMPDSLLLDQRGMTADGMSNQRLPDMNTPTSALPQPLSLPNSSTTDPTADPKDSTPNAAIGDAVKALQDNPASYLSSMGVMASGEGYQVTAAMPSGLRNRLGLEPGDKVLSVNGQSIGSNPGQDANVLQQVQQAGEAQIQVQRGDQVITIRQQF